MIGESLPEGTCLGLWHHLEPKELVYHFPENVFLS